MRFLLVALALAACQRAAGPATPANKAPAPNYNAAAADELGFLTVDADIVFGLNVTELRNSQLWHVFEPQLEQMTRRFQDGGSTCGKDIMKTTQSVSLSLKMRDAKQFSGVFVMKGAEAARAMDCSISELKRKGGTATLDRGVMITTNPQMPRMVGAMTVIGQSTLVMQLDQVANHDTLTSLLAAGSPLRTSPTFMKMFERREPRAALWGMANGNSPVFAQMAASGLKPLSVDGTVLVTDRLIMTVRITMASPGEASTLAREVDKVKSVAAAYVQRLDAIANGSTTQITVEMTEAQIQSLVGAFASVMGP